MLTAGAAPCQPLKSPQALSGRGGHRAKELDDNLTVWTIVNECLVPGLVQNYASCLRALGFPTGACPFVTWRSSGGHTQA